MITIDEADALRTAADIKDLLNDGELHAWRDCIDLAREHVPDGNRGLASRLAWHALTELLAPLSTIWAGEKGERSIALTPTAERAQTVPCPTCGIPAGEQCLRRSGRGITSDPKTWPHEDRERVCLGAEPTRTARTQARTRSGRTTDRVPAQI